MFFFLIHINVFVSKQDAKSLALIIINNYYHFLNYLLVRPYAKHFYILSSFTPHR